MAHHHTSIRLGGFALLCAASIGLASSAAAAEGAPAGRIASLGEAGGNLVYTPLTPCRLLDTRQPSLKQGRIAGQTSRQFYALGGPFDIDQGGDAGDCGLFATGHEAIVVNITAVGPTQAGFLTAWPVGEDRPLAATLSYEPGQNISNEVIVPINNSMPAAEFEIYSYRDVHVVADVVGYFSRPQKAPLDCMHLRSEVTEISGGLGNARSPTCPSTHAATGGSCIVTSELALRTTRRATMTGEEVWFCSAKHDGGGVGTLSAEVTCCATPGR